MIKPNLFEKISLYLIKCIGSPFSLLVHTLLFGGFFVLRYLEFVSNAVLLVLTAIVSLEAIYLLICVQMIVKNNTKSVAQLQENIEEIQQEEEETHKLMVNILHLAHQMKTIQHDIAVLKKGNGFKTSGNGHRIHI